MRVTYSTEDSLKVKQIQKPYGIAQDGALGPLTIDCMYRGNAKVKYPYKAKLYGQDVFITKPNMVEPFNPKMKSLSNFKNSVTGSFSWTVNGTWQPISVLIGEGKVVCPTACHATDHNLPESVLWYQYDGTYGINRVKNVNELPNLSKIKWAIGGLGLRKDNQSNYYDARAEGFYRKVVNGRVIFDFSDVHRKTNHFIFGIDHLGDFITIFARNKTSKQCRQLAYNFGLTHAIIGEGGTNVPSINFDGIKLNLKTPQRYAIQLGG